MKRKKKFSHHQKSGDLNTRKALCRSREYFTVFKTIASNLLMFLDEGPVRKVSNTHFIAP